jgi:ribonuclease P protein component
VLKKINRISKKNEFEEVKNKGVMVNTPLFGLKLMKKEDKEKKFGFVVSKKISKRAVDRNRIRRLLAEAIRKKLKSFDEGVRGVFLIKREILGKKLIDIEENLGKCLKK